MRDRDGYVKLEKRLKIIFVDTCGDLQLAHALAGRSVWGTIQFLNLSVDEQKKLRMLADELQYTEIRKLALEAADGGTREFLDHLRDLVESGDGPPATLEALCDARIIIESLLTNIYMHSGETDE